VQDIPGRDACITRVRLAQKRQEAGVATGEVVFELNLVTEPALLRLVDQLVQAAIATAVHEDAPALRPYNAGHLVSVGRNNEVGCPDLEIRSRIPRCARDWDSSETQKNYIDWGADDQQVLDIVNEDTRTRLDKSDVRDEVGLAGV